PHQRAVFDDDVAEPARAAQHRVGRVPARHGPHDAHRRAQAVAAARPRRGGDRRQGQTQPPAQAHARGPRMARARGSGLAAHPWGDRTPRSACRRRPLAAGPARAELNGISLRWPRILSSATSFTSTTISLLRTRTTEETDTRADS